MLIDLLQKAAGVTGEKVSVIVPCFNAEDHIRECMECLIAQSMPHELTELIFVDAGSTDGTKDIIREYERIYPQLILLVECEINNGSHIGQLINLGISYASGAYFVPVDPADTFASDHLEKLYTSAVLDQDTKTHSIIINSKSLFPDKDVLTGLSGGMDPDKRIVLSYKISDTTEPDKLAARDYNLFARAGFRIEKRYETSDGEIKIHASELMIPQKIGNFNSKYKKLFVLCPAGVKSGGEELLHQLVSELVSVGADAYIAYYRYDPYQAACHPEFLKYVAGHIVNEDEIEDEEFNAVVIPEIYFSAVRNIRKAKKYFWWLSVDNLYAAADAFGVTHQEAQNTVKTADHQLCQSQYSMDHAVSIGIDKDKCFILSDYINESYTVSKPNFSPDNRAYRVVYNPAKGKEYTGKLIARAKEVIPDIEFAPIQNMSNDEVRELLNTSRVYIDFGEHPGKDRIPREAAASGLCVITGMKGAAAFEGDVPIPSKNKFDENTADLREIIERIRECVHDYQKNIIDFEDYRSFIESEREKFTSDVCRIFSVF